MHDHDGDEDTHTVEMPATEWIHTLRALRLAETTDSPDYQQHVRDARHLVEEQLPPSVAVDDEDAYPEHVDR